MVVLKMPYSKGLNPLHGYAYLACRVKHYLTVPLLMVSLGCRAELGSFLHSVSKLLHLSMSTLGNSILWRKGRALITSLSGVNMYIQTQHSLRQRRLEAGIDERRRRRGAYNCAMPCHDCDLTW